MQASAMTPDSRCSLRRLALTCVWIAAALALAAPAAAQSRHRAHHKHASAPASNDSQSRADMDRSATDATATDATATDATATDATASAEPASVEPASVEPASVEPATDVPPSDAAAPAPKEEPANLGPFERLPASAYPEPRVRGLYGGSLWATFHGLQWPYYRKSGIGVSGYVWIDTGYERLNRGNPSDHSIKYWLQQGRLLLRVTPTYTNERFFVQGQAELVANKDQNEAQPTIGDADDVWIRTGMWDVFDVQLGRFEGWEVYHFGMGLDLNTLERQGVQDSAPGIYGVTYAFYRPPNVGQAAVHLYPTDFLRFEIGSQLGNESGSNTLAARPVAILDFGAFKLKLGAEYKKLVDQRDNFRTASTNRGAGAALQFIIEPRVEFGFNGAYGEVIRIGSDGTVDEKASTATYSLGAFLNFRVAGDFLVGGGGNLTKLHDDHYDQALRQYGRFNHLQTFVALQYILWKQFFIKAVFAYAKGEFHPTFGDPIFDNTMLSARLRLMYLF
jgi:hypothetical protein